MKFTNDKPFAVTVPGVGEVAPGESIDTDPGADPKPKRKRTASTKAQEAES